MIEGCLTIGRARLHGAGSGAGDALRRVLDPVTPAALGLSPKATMIVQRVAMRARLPRQGSAESFSALLRDELRARAVSARRSHSGDGDADLLFEDEEEFEAAIVADWLDRPQGAPRAWWVPAVGAMPPPDRWRRLIFQDARFLPRILARLVRSGHAVPWLARFDDDEISAVASRLMTALAPAPVAQPDFAPPGAAPVKNKADDVTDVAVEASVTTPKHASAAPGLIAAVAPEALAAPSPAARRLLAVALFAVRRPAVLTTAAFAAALTEISRSAPVSVDAAKAARPRLAPHSPAPTVQRASAPVASDVRTLAPPAHTTIDPPSPDIAPPSSRQSFADTDPPPRAMLAPSQDERPAFAPDTPAAVPRPVVETEFGGLFFLLNAFVALGLYGTLADPRGSVRGLSPFELLDLLGCRWFGRAFRRDPLHPLLRDLAGLDTHEKPGALFEAPPWSVPAEWLAPWPEGRTLRGGRSHSAGFPLVGAPDRWLGCFARYLKARLARALGADAPLAMLCRRPARIAHDGEDVDIRMLLDTHPLAIRLAGLDRDPGWLPAAGCHIGFTFA